MKEVVLLVRPFSMHRSAAARTTLKRLITRHASKVGMHSHNDPITSRYLDEQC